MWRKFIADTDSVKQPPMNGFEEESSNDEKQSEIKNKEKEKDNTEKKLTRKTPVLGKKIRKKKKN